MEEITFYPGSFGEILQGKVKQRDLLFSSPVDIFTKVRVYEKKEVFRNLNFKKSYKFMDNLLKDWGFEKSIKSLDIDINSKIPIGKGLASSTADLCAVYYCLLKLFKRDFNREELIKQCIKIEPTDSIIFKEATLFDYKEGSYYQTLGNYFKFYIIAFEGEEEVDTLSFNNKSLPSLSSSDDLNFFLKKAVEERDISTISQISTESIIRNEKRLSYHYLKFVLKLQKEFGGLGIIGAHSGNVLGIIFDSEEKMEHSFKKIKDIGFGKLKVYKIKTLDKIPV